MKTIYTLNMLETFEDGTIREECIIASKDPSKLKDYAEREFPNLLCVTTLTRSYELCDDKISHLLITTLPTL